MRVFTILLVLAAAGLFGTALALAAWALIEAIAAVITTVATTWSQP